MFFEERPKGRKGVKKKNGNVLGKGIAGANASQWEGSIFVEGVGKEVIVAGLDRLKRNTDREQIQKSVVAGLGNGSLESFVNHFEVFSFYSE